MWEGHKNFKKSSSFQILWPSHNILTLFAYYKKLVVGPFDYLTPNVFKECALCVKVAVKNSQLRFLTNTNKNEIPGKGTSSWKPT